MINSKEFPLSLGTANFGFPYGITNNSGKLNEKIATSIVKEAWNNGIREFDTAQAYGRSEIVIGAALKNLGIGKAARVTTKLDPKLDHLDHNKIVNAVQRSLTRMEMDTLYSILLHQENLLAIWSSGLGFIIDQILSNGMAQHFGVSVYSPQKAIEAMEIDEIDIIQIPSNVLDRRFEEAGVFKEADRRQKQIYVRSVFLQGLLLIPAEDLSPQMAFAIPTLKAFQSFADSAGLSWNQLSLAYVRDAYPDAKIIFGAETPEQVRANMACWQTPVSHDMVMKIQDHFRDVDEKVLNPALW